MGLLSLPSLGIAALSLSFSPRDPTPCEADLACSSTPPLHPGLSRARPQRPILRLPAASAAARSLSTLSSRTNALARTPALARPSTPARQPAQRPAPPQPRSHRANDRAGPLVSTIRPPQRRPLADGFVPHDRSFPFLRPHLCSREQAPLLVDPGRSRACSPARPLARAPSLTLRPHGANLPSPTRYTATTGRDFRL